MKVEGQQPGAMLSYVGIYAQLLRLAPGKTSEVLSNPRIGASGSSIKHDKASNFNLQSTVSPVTTNRKQSDNANVQKGHESHYQNSTKRNQLRVP